MKAFRFGDMLRAKYPNDNGAALYVVGRVDNTDEPMLVGVNHNVRLDGRDPETIVEQGEAFTMQGIGYRCVTAEGFALGFDKL